MNTCLEDPALQLAAKNTGAAVLSTPEAATYIGLKAPTLAGWRCKGYGPPFVKLGGKVGYRVRDLEKWLERSLRRSTSERVA